MTHIHESTEIHIQCMYTWFKCIIPFGACLLIMDSFLMSKEWKEYRGFVMCTDFFVTQFGVVVGTRNMNNRFIKQEPCTTGVLKMCLDVQQAY